MFQLLAFLAIPLAFGPAEHEAVEVTTARDYAREATSQRSVVFTSPFTSCPSNTGGGATMLVPATALAAAEVPLMEAGDEIAVLAPDGSCVGRAEWDGDGVAFSIWADDAFTTTRDGLLPGERIQLAVWDASEGAAVNPDHIAVSFEDGFDPAGGFTPNGLFIVHSAAKTPPTAADAEGPELPALEQNRPNPVRDRTTFTFVLADAAPVVVDVYDSLGRQVARAFDREAQAGQTEVTFDSSALAPGLYVYRLTSPGFVRQRRMLVVR